jgi:hypothetical protein
MRRFFLSLPVCFAVFAGHPKPPDLPLIDRFQEQVQLRFETPLPEGFGMSRMVQSPSMGEHFHPVRTAERDFIPENATEREVVGKLEENGVQLGLYVFGRAILAAQPQSQDFRALKGPAAITRGTPRPAWYPGQPKISDAPADALPDWNAVYPLAQRAMRSIQDGGAGFETRLASWDIAARPVSAVSPATATPGVSAACFTPSAAPRANLASPKHSAEIALTLLWPCAHSAAPPMRGSRG